MAKPNADKPIALQVRMTEGLRRKLAASAEKNGRSLNAEILFRLGHSFDDDEDAKTRAYLKELVRDAIAKGKLG